MSIAKRELQAAQDYIVEHYDKFPDNLTHDEKWQYVHCLVIIAEAIGCGYRLTKLKV